MKPLLLHGLLNENHMRLKTVLFSFTIYVEKTIVGEILIVTTINIFSTV